MAKSVYELMRAEVLDVGNQVTNDRDDLRDAIYKLSGYACDLINVVRGLQQRIEAIEGKLRSEPEP